MGIFTPKWMTDPNKTEELNLWSKKHGERDEKRLIKAAKESTNEEVRVTAIIKLSKMHGYDAITVPLLNSLSKEAVIRIAKEGSPNSMAVANAIGMVSDETMLEQILYSMKARVRIEYEIKDLFKSVLSRIHSEDILFRLAENGMWFHLRDTIITDVELRYKVALLPKNIMGDYEKLEFADQLAEQGDIRCIRLYRTVLEHSSDTDYLKKVIKTLKTLYKSPDEALRNEISQIPQRVYWQGVSNMTCLGHDDYPSIHFDLSK